MAKYHITTAGNPAPCKATVNACPRGGADEHYASKGEAAEAYEKKMEGEVLKAFEGNEGLYADEEFREKVARTRRIEDAVLKSDPKKIIKPVPHDKRKNSDYYSGRNDEYYVHPDFRKALPSDEDLGEYMTTVHSEYLSDYQKEEAKVKYDERTHIVTLSYPYESEDPELARRRRAEEAYERESYSGDYSA
jgi:hypothetical protein